MTLTHWNRARTEIGTARRGKVEKMQAYEVYFIGAEGECDSEWGLLGKIESDSDVHAQEQTMKQWQEYPSRYLVLCPCSTKRECIPVLPMRNAA